MSAPATAATALPVASPVTRSSAALSRSEEHTSELQSQSNLVCRLLLEKKNTAQTDRGQERRKPPRRTSLASRSAPRACRRSPLARRRPSEPPFVQHDHQTRRGSRRFRV